MTTRLSNRQYAALRMFTDEALLQEVAISVDQRSLGSIFHRGYIEYDARRESFRMTKLGKRVLEEFEQTVVINDHPSKNFSHYIRTIRTLADYTTYTHKERYRKVS